MSSQQISKNINRDAGILLRVQVVTGSNPGLTILTRELEFSLLPSIPSKQTLEQQKFVEIGLLQQWYSTPFKFVYPQM
jgi:hypothetical protein